VDPNWSVEDDPAPGFVDLCSLVMVAAGTHLDTYQRGLSRSL
jgi:hypothetical protein